MASFYQDGVQPAISLTHAFLQKHPILLEEDCLLVNWNRIPGLYSWTDQLLTVSIADALWVKWGQPGGWTAWEPNTQAGNFIPNMAVVVCKGAFHDAPDPQQQTKVGHFMTIARVPDCIKLLPFEQLREAFNSYQGAATAVALVRLHKANTIFPDVYFQYYGEHFTIMGLQDLEIRFGMADEFVGGYLVHQHIGASGRKAHAMLPSSYVQGAKCPKPSPTYTYRPGRTGIPGEHPPVHVIYMAATGTVLSSPQRFCIAEAPATQWSFDDVPVPWILPESYRNPNQTVPDDLDDDEVTGGSASAGPDSGPPAETADNDDSFETVADGEEVPGTKVIIRILAKKTEEKPEGSGSANKNRLFDSKSNEEDNPEVQQQIDAALDAAGPLRDLQLSDDEDSKSDSESSDDGDELKDTKEYHPDQGDEGGDPLGAPESSGNPASSKPEVPSKGTTPAKPAATKGKGPSNESSGKAPASTKGKGPSDESSGKAPASKEQFSAVTQGVQERVQSTLFSAATLAQALDTEGDTIRRLENYTGLLAGFQKLVCTMASGYEVATEDIQSLVASTLDMATQWDCAFVVEASQALTVWTTKYQQAMSQGENWSMQDQLASWEQVRQAGIALSRKITTLTTEHEESTASGEIFRTLLLACFQHVRVWTEATYVELNANLPSLLCRFVAPDQAGHILASIFTCLCNYNTEICGMAMAQTVVPVFTIPNTYRVQQSLWESMCRIIPGIAQTNEGNLRSFEPTTSRNKPEGQSGMVPATGSSGDRGTGTAQRANPPSTAAAPTHKGSATKDANIVRIPPASSKWEFFHWYDPKLDIPTVDLTNNGDAPDTRPQGTSTPVTAGPVSERCPSKKKIDVPKVEAFHLISALQDWQECAQRSAETENQAPSSMRISIQERGSSVGLPHGLPATLPNLVGGLPSIPLGPTPEAPERGTKSPQDEDIEELPDEGEPAGPPKKKKKKKKSNTSKDEVSLLEGQLDQSQPSTSTAEHAEDTKDPAPVPALEEILEEEHKSAKKKKKKQKKDAGHGKLTLEQRVARAKEIAKARHRPLQHKHDFKAVRDYRKSLAKETLETINGVDHSDFLLGKLHEADNYMSQKTGHERNLMSVNWLLSRIAKYADDPQKWLMEAQTVVKSTFSMVQGMPAADKCSPELAVRVLMDCSSAVIDCNHREYGKEQNMGLYDVIHPATTGYGTGDLWRGGNSHHHQGWPSVLPILCICCLQSSGCEQPRPYALPGHTGMRMAGVFLRTHAVLKDDRAQLGGTRHGAGQTVLGQEGLRSGLPDTSSPGDSWTGANSVPAFHRNSICLLQPLKNEDWRLIQYYSRYILLAFVAF